MSLTALFFANVTCPANSVVSNVVNLASPFACTCSVGFWTNVSVCVACNYMCATCTNGTSCVACINESTRNTTTSTCPCLSGFFDGGSLTCLSCTLSLYCLTCTNSTACLTCNSTLYRSLVSGNCTCITGYYDSGTPACAACNYMCATCTNATSCVTCMAEPTRNSSGAPACPCLVGYYNAGSLACPACLNYCQSCTNGTACISCKTGLNRNTSDTLACGCLPGFYANGTAAACIACNYMCATCTSAVNCTTCKTGVSRNTTITVTCPCSPGFYDQGVAVCSACAVNCFICTGTSTNCTSCNASAYRALNGSNCLCMTGYFNSSVDYPVCQTCPVGCAACQSQTNCSSCDQGYSLQQGLCAMDLQGTAAFAVNSKLQTINTLTLELTFTDLVGFNGDLTSLLKITNENSAVPYQLISVSNYSEVSSVRVTVTITDNMKTLVLSFTTKAIRTVQGNLVTPEPQSVSIIGTYIFG